MTHILLLGRLSLAFSVISQPMNRHHLPLHAHLTVAILVAGTRVQDTVNAVLGTVLVKVSVEDFACLFGSAERRQVNGCTLRREKERTVSNTIKLRELP